MSQPSRERPDSRAAAGGDAAAEPDRDDDLDDDGDEHDGDDAVVEVPPAATLPAGTDSATVLRLLSDGELSIEGRLLDASNATLYCTVALDDLVATCVYKPVRGERPLWDFPDGTLAEREHAAYLVSDATGWDLVPPTVLRDGPFGSGMCQLWLDGDPDVDLVALSRSRHPDLRRLVVLDAVINNADRKGGHLLATPDGRVRGCDHGVCFSAEDKLRTILWQWRGKRLGRAELDMLTALRTQLDGDLGALLHERLTLREVRATILRVERLLATGSFPEPSPDWPAVPWPPW